MKKTLLIVLSLILLGIVVNACTEQTTAPTTGIQNSNAVNNPPSSNTQNTATNTQPSQDTGQPATSLSQLYNYGMIKSYEYQITAGTVTSTIKTDISSDTVNGQAAWLESTDMQAQGYSGVVKTWIDKTTYQCIKITTEINVNGQTMNTDTPCASTTSPSAKPTGNAPMSGNTSLYYVGKESVTVPAGTFNADKYEVGNVTYWVATGKVPLPIKVSYNNGEMVLVSYS